MGLTGDEVKVKTPSIIEFADIGEYIDEPIKHYSSGMVVRLAFAIVTTLQADVLITDEVLAVGDESFQKKCVSWLEAFLSNGGTLLLCSHSMFHIQKLCQKACWIHQGSVRALGDAFDVTGEYLAYHEKKSAQYSSLPVASGASGLYRVTQMQIGGRDEPNSNPVFDVMVLSNADPLSGQSYSRFVTVYRMAQPDGLFY